MPSSFLIDKGPAPTALTAFTLKPQRLFLALPLAKKKRFKPLLKRFFFFIFLFFIYFCFLARKRASGLFPGANDAPLRAFLRRNALNFDRLIPRRCFLDKDVSPLPLELLKKRAVRPKLGPQP